MSAADSLRSFVEALDQAGVPYMLTGSYASSFHSLPRATRDVDFVIEPTRQQVRALVSAFPRDRFYVDEQVAVEALDTHGQFNVVDMETGWKADFMIRKPRPFSRSEFERRYRVTLDGIELTIATAEDVLLAKLEWARLGASERQVEDVASILRTRGQQLDRAYIEEWVEDLDVREQWIKAMRLAGLEPA